MGTTTAPAARARLTAPALMIPAGPFGPSTMWAARPVSCSCPTISFRARPPFREDDPRTVCQPDFSAMPAMMSPSLLWLIISAGR